ncbi:MAG: hypothetical protein AAF944_27725 [Bacteroidota bacterium]
MLSLNEFDDLSFYDKAQYLWDYGTYIADRTYSQFRITLYHVDDFFVEVMYNRIGNKIISIASYQHRSILNKYVEEVSLPDLF